MRNRMCSFAALAGSALTLVLLAGVASAEAPALTALQVYPPEVSLLTARGRQALSVQATYADGITRDVTAEAKLSLANPGLARLGKGTLYPVADGATELRA